MSNSDKKIAFVNTSYSWGGLEMNVVRLASWLKDYGLNITIFCLENSPIAEAANNFQLSIVYIKKHRKYFDIFKANTLRRLFESKKIEIVFIFDNRDLSTIAISKFLSKNKIKIIFQQQMLIAGSKKDIFHRWHHSFIDKWIAPLNILKTQVEEYTTIPLHKIKVIPLGVDIKKLLNNKISKQDARAKLKISADTILIGIVGRIDKLKGQDFLIEAVNKLRQENYNIELLIAGEPTREKAGADYNNYILQLVKEYNIEKYVHFYSFFDNVGILYSALDIFALATQNETFGMVTVEAMLFSKPIIATNSGGTPEILCDGEFGLLYENRNLEDFLVKMKTLIEDEKLRENIAEKASEEAINKYSHKTEVDEILKIIETL